MSVQFCLHSNPSFLLEQSLQFHFGISQLSPCSVSETWVRPLSLCPQLHGTAQDSAARIKPRVPSGTCSIQGRWTSVHSVHKMILSSPHRQVTHHPRPRTLAPHTGAGRMALWPDCVQRHLSNCSTMVHQGKPGAPIRTQSRQATGAEAGGREFSRRCSLCFIPDHPELRDGIDSLGVTQQVHVT